MGLCSGGFGILKLVVGALSLPASMGHLVPGGQVPVGAEMRGCRGLWRSGVSCRGVHGMEGQVQWDGLERQPLRRPCAWVPRAPVCVCLIGKISSWIPGLEPELKKAMTSCKSQSGPLTSRGGAASPLVAGRACLESSFPVPSARSGVRKTFPVKAR